MNKYYRLIEIDERGNFKTLFHSIDGRSRKLPKNKWIKANRRLGSEGAGRKYITGFHVLEKLEDIQKYSKKFKIKHNRRIVSLHARGLRPKRHSPSPVMLANHIFIPSDCEVYGLH